MSARQDTARRDAVLADLRARLAEPHRVYHGQAHVDALLADLDDRRGAFHDSEAVELAVWFHDAVHIAGVPNNERASVALLHTAMAGLRLRGAVERTQVPPAGRVGRPDARAPATGPRPSLVRP